MVAGVFGVKGFIQAKNKKKKKNNCESQKIPDI